MDNITEVNARYIFADGERIKASAKLLTEIKQTAKDKYKLYAAMYDESRKIADDYKLTVDKMPFHTEAEIKSLHNALDVIHLKLDNQYRREAVCVWDGMCRMSHMFLENMDHWRKIYNQTIHALEAFK